MLRYDEKNISQIAYGDFAVYEIRLGDILIWEQIILSNFFSSDNKYIVTTNGLVFNSKKE